MPLHGRDLQPQLDLVGHHPARERHDPARVYGDEFDVEGYARTAELLIDGPAAAG